MKSALFTAASALALVSAPVVAQPMDMPGMKMSTPEKKAAPERAEPKQKAHDDPTGHGQPGQMNMPMENHRQHAMEMTGALGRYPMQRESSGTAWQPDTSEHLSLMEISGDWTLMAHGVLNLVYDHQSGPRGGKKAFSTGMLMGMARRPLGNGTLQ